MAPILIAESQWLRKAYWLRKPNELETVLVVKIRLNRALIVYSGVQGEYLRSIPTQNLVLTCEMVPPPILRGRLLGAKY